MERIQRGGKRPFGGGTIHLINGSKITVGNFGTIILNLPTIKSLNTVA